MNRIRHLLLPAAALLVAVAAKAQPEPGTWSLIPRIGVAISNISHEDLSISANTSGTYYSLNGKYREGFAGGVDLQYQATTRLAVSAGVFYTRQGCKYEDSDLTGFEPGIYSAFSNCCLNLDYINIPLLAHLYIAKGLSVNAGVQYGYLASRKMHTENTTVTINKDGSYTYADNPEKDDEEYPFAKRHYFTIPFGISYEYANVVLDLRYNLGISKTFDLNGSGENQSFAFTVGYKLNL